MNETKMVTNVRRVSEAASVVEIHGEINAFAENVLMDAYTQAADGDTRTIILDFNGMEYMNSGGIGLLVTLLIRANRQGLSLIAVGLNEHYQHIFELTRLNEAIRIYDDEAEALASVAAS